MTEQANSGIEWNATSEQENIGISWNDTTKQNFYFLPSSSSQLLFNAKKREGIMILNPGFFLICHKWTFH